jgi:isoleucyl-tRNA synthetase
VHLSDWPEAGKVDGALIRSMALVRDAITDGLSKRAEAAIKVRQPLAKAVVWDAFDPDAPRADQFTSLVADELNVKEVEARRSGDPGSAADKQAVSFAKVDLDTNITPELKAEGMMRDVVRHVQNARKETGLEVDDRIVLTLQTDDADLAEAIKAHAATIKAETLATELKYEGADDQVPVKVSGAKLYVGVEKAK